jgi:hypothetical protein
MKHSASIELLFVIEQREAEEFHDKEGKPSGAPGIWPVPRQPNVRAAG